MKNAMRYYKKQGLEGEKSTEIEAQIGSEGILGPTLTLSWPKLAQVGPKMAQIGPKMCQVKPKMAQDGPQDGPR